jgi:hypothetical protein
MIKHRNLEDLLDCIEVSDWMTAIPFDKSFIDTINAVGVLCRSQVYLTPERIKQLKFLFAGRQKTLTNFNKLLERS